jgi:hypothetical protein
MPFMCTFLAIIQITHIGVTDDFGYSPKKTFFLSFCFFFSIKWEKGREREKKHANLPEKKQALIVEATTTVTIEIENLYFFRWNSFWIKILISRSCYVREMKWCNTYRGWLCTLNRVELFNIIVRFFYKWKVALFYCYTFNVTLLTYFVSFQSISFLFLLSIARARDSKRNKKKILREKMWRNSHFAMLLN